LSFQESVIITWLKSRVLTLWLNQNKMFLKNYSEHNRKQYVLLTRAGMI